MQSVSKDSNKKTDSGPTELNSISETNAQTDRQTDSVGQYRC